MALDRIIHERSRLRIVTYLAGVDPQGAGFNEIRDALDLTAGNLSVQLTRLKDAGYAAIKKTFRNNRPHTEIRLTERGRRALDAYLAEMEEIIRTVRE